MNTGPRPPYRPRRTPEGQRRTDERIALGLRVSDVSGALGINQARVYEAETGSKRVSEEVERKIDDFLEMMKRKRKGH